jgi:hypothetical protein
MSYKTFVDKKAFSSLEPFGLQISTLPEVANKASVGLMLGAMTIV